MRTGNIWTYSLHPKSSTAIHHLEEVFIFLTPEPTEFRDLEIRPEMAHIVLLSLHCLRIDLRNRGVVGVASQNFFRQRMLEVGVIFRNVLWLFRLRLNEHLPKSLRGQVVDSFVCGCVSEDIGYRLLQLLDCDCESVGLVRFDHLEERVTISC